MTPCPRCGRPAGLGLCNVCRHSDNQNEAQIYESREQTRALALQQHRIAERQHRQHIQSTTDANYQGQCMACHARVKPDATRCRRCQINLIPFDEIQALHQTIADAKEEIKRIDDAYDGHQRAVNPQVQAIQDQIDRLQKMQDDSDGEYIVRWIGAILLWFVQAYLLNGIYAYLFGWHSLIGLAAYGFAAYGLKRLIVKRNPVVLFDKEFDLPSQKNEIARLKEQKQKIRGKRPQKPEVPEIPLEYEIVLGKIKDRTSKRK